MHVTKKVSHPPCETAEHLPEAQMDVGKHTANDVARTDPPFVPTASLHRSESSEQDHSHLDPSSAKPEPTDILDDGARHLKLDVLQRKYLTDVSEAYRRRYSVYVNTKSANSSQRMAVYNRLGNLQLNLDRLQGTLDKFMAKANSSNADASTKKPKSRLKKLRTEVQLDVEAMGGQIQAVNGQMAELREQDRRLQHAEDAFDNAARAVSTALRRLRLIDDDENFDMRSEVSLASSSAYRSIQSDALASPVFPELAEYYKAFSDLRIMHERFMWLENERNEQWERRVMLEEQDQFLDQTEDEFIEAWEKRLNEAEVNYEDAKAATEEARLACHAAEITIPDLDDAIDASSADADSKQQPFNASHNHTIIPPNIRPPSQIFDDIVPETLPEDPPSSQSLTPPARQHLMMENRISQWVDDVVPPIASISSPVESREPPADNSKNSTGMDSLVRLTSSIARSMSCPAQPRPSCPTSIEPARPHTARSVGAEDSLVADEAIWAAGLPELTLPP